MLLFYYGNAFQVRQEKTQAVLKNLKEKKENANYIYYDSFDINEEHLKELLKSQGLFEKKNIVFLSNIFLNLDLKKWILEHLEDFKNSESAFIFSEEKLTPAEVKKIKEFSFDFKDFKKAEKTYTNLWTISDYIQTKNKKKAWIFFQEQIHKNIFIEEFFPIIFWSIKNLNIVNNFKQNETNLKDFQYKKARNNLKFWSEHEIEEKLFDLILIHSESRRGKINLLNSVERFLLEL